MAVAVSQSCTLPQTGLSQWYMGHHASNKAISSAQAAFEEATEIFKQRLTKDTRKKDFLIDLQAHNLQDVLDVVLAAQARYVTRKEHSSICSAITSFSQRVHYYSNVLDVFSQHHPEYVSLAWGMMKLVFGGVVEHERSNATLLTALNDLADSLPRVEFTLILYPTLAMQDAVAKLYACTIKLLLRALDWYEEGRMKHALHAITRPVALRYRDLVAECRSNTEAIRNLASISGQAEMRDMHQRLFGIQRVTEDAMQVWNHDSSDMKTQLSALTTLVEGIRGDLLRDRATSIAATIDVSSRLSDIQFAQALGHISTRCSIDHKAALHGLITHCSRQRPLLHSKSPPFWMSTKLLDWNSSLSSSSIFLKGTYQERTNVRSFCVEIIRQLLSTTTAVLYVLQEPERTYSLHEILKSLISQSLSLNNPAIKRFADASVIRKFCDVHVDEDFLNLLGQILESLDVVFIIVNAESMEPDTALQCRTALRDLSQKLADRQAKTVLRVLTTSQSPRYPVDVVVDDRVLKIGGVRAQHHNSRMLMESKGSKRAPGPSGPLGGMWQNHKRRRVR